LKKLKTIPFLLIVMTLLLAACGAANQEVTAPVADETVVEEVVVEEDSGIVEAANAPAAADAQVEDTAVQTTTTNDVVTEQTYIDIYNRVNPSVVNIQVLGEPSEFPFEFERIIPFDPDLEEIPEEYRKYFENPDEYDLEDLPEDFPEEYREFFQGDDPHNFLNPDDLPLIPSTGQGSGFVYDSQGHIVTNNHVIRDATEITVIFSDGTEADATLVGADSGSDLAVIKVEVDSSMLVPVTIADSDALQIGELVATIGNPYGLDGSMSTGIISGLGRTLPGAAAPGGSRFNIPNIIQTDAAINPGNSGGPLLNLEGEVIGVNTALQSDPSNFNAAPSFAGIGYVVPSNILQRVVPELIENGEIAHPWLGISGNTLTADVATAMGLEPDQRGVLVHLVLEDGPAAKAGLLGNDSETQIDGFDVPIGGDIIVQINDQVVNEFEDLLGYIVTRGDVGQPVSLQLIRDGELINLEATLEARPSN